MTSRFRRSRGRGDVRPRTNDPDFAKRTVKWDHEAFPKSTPLVEAAESVTDPVKAEAAFRTAIESLKAEREAPTVKNDPDAWGRLIGRARAGLGLALHAQNRDLDAALMLADDPYDPHGCHATVRARCNEYAQLVARKFPGMVFDEGSVRLFSLGEVLLDRSTSVESLDFLPRKLESPTLKPHVERILRQVQGEATFVGANVVARTSSADGANVTEQKEIVSKGNANVYLVVEPKQAKRASKTLLDLGKVSVVRAPKRGD